MTALDDRIGVGHGGQSIAVRCTDVVKHYDGGLVEALRGVSFSVARGEAIAVVGPSGSGKTTLLHLVGALDLPTRGTVEIMGQDLHGVRDLDALRGRTLGFVFQLHNLIPNLSLRDNVSLPTYPLGLSRQERRKKAADLLEQVGLGHRIDFLPVKCSGGERQRAAIARALVNDPKILLSDEPTGSVDTVTGAKILDLYDHLVKERGVTTITITHNDDVARRAHRILRMQDGLLTEVSAKTAPAAPS